MIIFPRIVLWIYGFNKFVRKLPSINVIGTEDFDYQIRKKFTTCLINIGLNELIQYSLVRQETFSNNDVKLINALLKDYSNLWVSLLPNLLRIVDENYKKRNLVVEKFEYDHVFSKKNSKHIYKKESIAGIFGGTKIRSNWSSQNKILDWFDAKGKIDQLFKKIKFRDLLETILANKK